MVVCDVLGLLNISDNPKTTPCCAALTAVGHQGAVGFSAALYEPFGEVCQLNPDQRWYHAGVIQGLKALPVARPQSLPPLPQDQQVCLQTHTHCSQHTLILVPQPLQTASSTCMLKLCTLISTFTRLIVFDCRKPPHIHPAPSYLPGLNRVFTGSGAAEKSVV